MAIVQCTECGGQVSSDAASCPHCGKPRHVKQKTSGCAWIALALVVLFGGPVALSVINGARQRAEGRTVATTPAARAPTAAEKAAKTARLEQCRETLKKSQQLDVLHNMTFDGGRPKVWVDKTWHQLPIEAKTEFARTAACFFLAGNSAEAITFPIYDGFSGKQIATWRFTRLDVE